jgi:hypothetical protein
MSCGSEIAQESIVQNCGLYVQASDKFVIKCVYRLIYRDCLELHFFPVKFAVLLRACRLVDYPISFF